MYTTCGSPLNVEAIPDTAIHPTCSGYPPIGETMRKTNDVLVDCSVLANKLLDFLASAPPEKSKEPDAPRNLQQASLLNSELAANVMHKLELALDVLGGCP